MHPDCFILRVRMALCRIFDAGAQAVLHSLQSVQTVAVSEVEVAAEKQCR